MLHTFDDSLEQAIEQGVDLAVTWDSQMPMCGSTEMYLSKIFSYALLPRHMSASSFRETNLMTFENEFDNKKVTRILFRRVLSSRLPADYTTTAKQNRSILLSYTEHSYGLLLIWINFKEIHVCVTWRYLPRTDTVFHSPHIIELQ